MMRTKVLTVSVCLVKIFDAAFNLFEKKHMILHEIEMKMTLSSNETKQRRTAFEFLIKGEVDFERPLMPLEVERTQVENHLALGLFIFSYSENCQSTLDLLLVKS